MYECLIEFHKRLSSIRTAAAMHEQADTLDL